MAVGGHGVSGVVCGVSGGLVGMAGGCTVGGRLGGYLSLGGAGGLGCWAGAAVSVVGGALLGSSGAWTSRTAVLGLELLALVLGPKETGGPVKTLKTAAAWTWGGDPGAGTGGYWIGTGKGLVGRLGVGRLTGGVPGLMGTSTASEPVGAGSWLGDAGLAVNRVGTESGLRSGLLAASVTLSMAATCGFQNCGGAGYEACLGCYLWSF